MLRGSVKAVAPSIASRKYSTSTPLSAAALENVQSTRTAWVARMIGDSSLACATWKATTTGFGVAPPLAFAVPGVGPGERGDASQFAGSFDPALVLNRWSERPLY